MNECAYLGICESLAHLLGRSVEQGTALREIVDVLLSVFDCEAEVDQLGLTQISGIAYQHVL